MTRIIPHDLIKHLEWKSGSKPPVNTKSDQSSGGTNFDGELLRYIQVGIPGIYGNPVVISPFELEGFGNLNYEQAHFKLFENKRYMPTPKIFMAHFNNVVAAFNHRKKLLYADGTEVSGDVVEDFYKHQVTNHKNVYGREDVGAWTWLNGRFIDGSGSNDMNLERVVGIEDGKLKTSTEQLKDCIMNDIYVNLEFNDQGLAVRKDDDQDYRKGENIRFWYPRKNAVARFFALSFRALLYCNGDPSGSSPSLGVFACAEGTARKNKLVH